MITAFQRINTEHKRSATVKPQVNTAWCFEMNLISSATDFSCVNK